MDGRRRGTNNNAPHRGNRSRARPIVLHPSPCIARPPPRLQEGCACGAPAACALAHDDGWLPSTPWPAGAKEETQQHTLHRDHAHSLISSSPYSHHRDTDRQHGTEEGKQARGQAPHDPLGPRRQLVEPRSGTYSMDGSLHAWVDDSRLTPPPPSPTSTHYRRSRRVAAISSSARAARRLPPPRPPSARRPVSTPRTTSPSPAARPATCRSPPSSRVASSLAPCSSSWPADSAASAWCSSSSWPRAPCSSPVRPLVGVGFRWGVARLGTSGACPMITPFLNEGLVWPFVAVQRETRRAVGGVSVGRGRGRGARALLFFPPYFPGCALERTDACLTTQFPTSAWPGRWGKGKVILRPRSLLWPCWPRLFLSPCC